jgi:hypothetical protein
MNFCGYETLLGRISSLSSCVADCLDLEEDLECDEDALKILNLTIQGITELQSVQGKEYRSVLTELNTFKKQFLEGQKSFGAMELDYEDGQVMARACSVIRDYCYDTWEKQREERLKAIQNL